IIPLLPTSTFFPYTTLFRSYNRVKVNLTTLEASLDDLEVGISQSKNYLKLLMGIPMDASLELQPQDFEVDLGKMLPGQLVQDLSDRKSTRLNSSHVKISYAV